MTVVNPKSISGINSITTGSGSDNLLTIHTSDASSTERVRINSSGDVIVGSGITVSPDGDVFTTGVTTATTFVGNLTGTASANAVLTGSTNNQLVTVTGANAITGESALTFDGSNFNFTRATSGDARMYIYGGEGGDARLLLASDEGDDHIDTYEIRAQASDNALAIYQFESGSYVQRFLIANGGKIVMGNSTTSTTQLDIRFTDTTTYSATSNHVNGLKIFNDCTTDNGFAGIELAATDADDYFGSVLLKAVADGTNYSNDFVIQTRHSGNHGERLRIDSSGKSYFMSTTSGGFNSTTLPNGHTVNINTKTSTDGLSVIRYSGSYGPYAINIGRSKSDTLGTNTLVANGDDLGHITWYGADGSDFNQAAAITAQVHGTPSDGTDMPGRLIFKVSADGSGTPTERLRIISTGVLQVNTTVTPGGNPSGGGTSNSGGFLHLMAANNENAMSLINATSIPNNSALGTILTGINFVNRNYYESSGRAGTGYVVRSEKGHSSYMDRCQLRLIPGYDGNTTYISRSVVFDFDGHILPGQDNNANLGGGSYRWETLYAANSSINTSDETLKQDVASLTAAEMNAAKRISKLFVTYKWKKSVSEKGDKARIHTGIIAQRIKEALEAEGLTAANYSFWCENITWKDSEGNVAGDGRTTGPGVYDELTGTTPSTDGYTKSVDYAVRYTELLSFVAAYNEQRFTSIESRLDAAGL